MESERFTGEKGIKILQEFVERYDKKIEADVHEYAELLVKIEQYKEKLKYLRKKEKQLEMLFDTFVSEEVYKKDCRHFDEIGAIRNTTNTKLQQCEKQLEMNKEYYELLREKDECAIDCLWCRRDFASKLAAIYYGYGWRVDWCVTTIMQPDMPFELWAYINSKAIIASGNKCDLESLGYAKMGEPVDSDYTEEERARILTAIKSMNSIQKTKECQQEVEKCCQEMDAEIEEYESFIESYNAYKKSMQEQLRALGAEHFGRQYDQLVRETESWFKEATSAIGAEIVIRNDEIIKIKTKRPSVYDMKELMQDRPSGLGEEELERTRNNLKHCRTDGISRKKLSEAYDRLIAELNTRMEQIAEEKEAEIARRRVEAEAAAIAKEKRRALIKKIIPVAIVLLIAAAAGMTFYLRYMTNTYYGTSFYLGTNYNYDKYKIARSVKEVPGGIFQGTGIKSITIPKSVEKIGDEAFSGCESLTEVVFKDGVTTIGNKAFSGCNSLTEIALPNSLETIGNSAFENCGTLVKVTFSESLTTIGTAAFSGCKELQELSFPEGLTTIGNEAFSGCTAIEEVMLPESLVALGEKAFAGCTFLKRVEFQADSLDVGADAFMSCGSLTEIQNTGNFEGLEKELAGAVKNCCNLDMSDRYDGLYCEAIEGIPLLENQVQFMNLMDNRKLIPDNTDAFYVDLAKDIMYDVEIEEEVKDGTSGRSVDFSFAMDRGILRYQFEGTLQNGSFGEDIVRCVGNDMDEKLKLLKEGDQTILKKLLEGKQISAENEKIIISEENVSVLEYEVIEKEDDQTYIPMKIQISRDDKDVSFMGTLLLNKHKLSASELKQDNAAYSDGSGGAQAQLKNPADWSIYNSKGEVKEEFYFTEQNIPEGAFEWGGNHYYVYNNRHIGAKTWDDSKAFCESLGGHMAYIMSPEENEALHTFLGNNNAYFGATDAEEEGVWKWLNGEPVEYTNWHVGEPNFTEEYHDYAAFYEKFTDGTWNDNGFGYYASFICEWE